jgi:hypothetical protein
MNLTPEQRDQVAAELRTLATNLNLTDDQKAKLHDALAEARIKVADYMKANPNVTKADIAKQIVAHRDQLRQRIVNFLNPDQLKTWDAEVAKAKEFLGQRMAA